MACLTLGIAVASLSSAGSAVAAVKEPRTAAAAEFILRSQLPDGAITQDQDRTRVAPYLANFAALGLARSYQLLHNPAYLRAAWMWLAWYQRHMDANGYVTDYTVGPGPAYAEVSTRDEDSTDAYAGTFLLALHEAYAVSGDRAKLRGLVPGLARAVAAIRSTQQSDGLTWAKPGYHVKYLMDQAESYAGLRAGADLAHDLGLTVLQERATLAADSMRAGVAGMWQRSGSARLYAFAKLEDGSLQRTTWSSFYADSVSQAWAVAVGNWLSPSEPLIAPTRATHLVATFTSRWPQWASPGAKVSSAQGPMAVDYWPLVGGALISTGHGPDGVEAASAIQSYARAHGEPWPFSVASAGAILAVG